MQVFLIISELPVLQGYFDRNWPLMGQDSGFITLAAVMMILGVAVLGNLNTEATSQESLGLPFWRVILSAGILGMVMSAVNVLSVSWAFPSQNQTELMQSTELYLRRPRNRRQRTPRPGIRSRRPPQSSGLSKHNKRQPAVVQPQPEARGLAAHIQLAFVCPPVSVEPERIAVPVEDIGAHSAQA